MHAKCMFRCCMAIYAILIGFLTSILRCFRLKVILHGFVHFACFCLFERYFQN